MEAWVALIPSLLRTEVGGYAALAFASLVFAMLLLSTLTARNVARTRELGEERLRRHRAEEVATMLYEATMQLRMDTDEDETLRIQMLALSKTLVPTLGDHAGLLPPFSQSVE